MKSKMNKTLIIIATCMIFSYVAIAQKIVSTSGTDFSSSSWQLSWTIGEPVINTFSNANYTLTQGFHQPLFSSQNCNLTLAVSTVNATCNQHNGSATVNVTGGASPYQYAWTSGSQLATADSLIAGIYMVTVSDANGCSKFTLANISNTTGTVISSSSITNLTCYNSQNGAINISVTDGSTPYSFLWSNGNTTEDISNLTEGPYEIEITDNSGCITTASYFVNQPNKIQSVITTTSATCMSTDGTATINVNGGTSPYTYNWSVGGASATLSNLSAGNYTVSVTDSLGCTTTPIMVNINTTGGPIITVDSVLQTGCSGSDGAIYTSVSGGTSPYTYLWSNGATTSNIYSLTSNIYSLTLTDANNCVAATSVEITSIVPSVPQICIVTVDSTEHKNLIVWEKEVTNSIDHYNIYREGSWAGYYFLAGSVNYDDFSQFLDVNSNPKMRAYRYKITAVNQCGNESTASTPHKTIHLAINKGLGNTMNLIWTEYEGFYFPGYYIYRHLNSQGWTLIDSIATGYNSYTDMPPNQGQLSYMIAINSAQICTPTGISKTQTGPYSQSISNIDDYGIWINVNSVTNNKFDVNIYPNPAENQITVNTSFRLMKQLFDLMIFDISGREVLSSKLKENNQLIDISSLSKGIYFVKIKTNEGVFVKELIKQ